MKTLLNRVGWIDRHGNWDKEEIKIDLIIIALAVVVALIVIIYA